MTVRIVLVQEGPPGTIKLDGRLTGADVPELNLACQQIKGQLILDLSDLRSLDRQGASALRELRAKGAELTGLSPYARLLVEPGQA
jgi:anti-anti-sigma regulatory factor